MKPAQPTPRLLRLTCGHSVFVQMPDDKSPQHRVVPAICGKCRRQFVEHRLAATYQTKG
jgi:hypothetical protein